MSVKPAWLPEMIVLDGEWEKTLVRLYAIFEQDFIRTKRTLDHREVWWDRRKSGGKYEEGFWHIISTTDPTTKERLPDFRRAERLPWCGPTISNSADPVVKFWNYLEGSGKVRTYLWLENWDYVIVLEKRKQRIGEVAFLITAYHVSGDSSRRKLKRQYGQRIR